MTYDNASKNPLIRPERVQNENESESGFSHYSPRSVGDAWNAQKLKLRFQPGALPLTPLGAHDAAADPSRLGGDIQGCFCLEVERFNSRREMIDL